MRQAEQLYKLKTLLDNGRCVSPADLQVRLEMSHSTIKRYIRHLRDRMNVPILWCPERGGWYLDRNQSVVGTQYELPGLWLSADEVHALLTMQHLLSNLDSGGILGPHIQPLKKLLMRCLDGGVPPDAEVARRIRVLTVGARRIQLPHFQAVGTALLRRQRLLIHYYSRGSNERTEREVSPQRLVHYRDNWYVDAWCHRQEAVRSFGVDAIELVRILDQRAIDVPDAQLDDVLGAGYGIFAGSNVRRATLRFSKEKARWVAAERWHPNQVGRWDAEGRWLLDLPYSDPRELAMDILRHMPHVEVLAPEELCVEVVQRLREGIRAQGGALDE